MSEEYEKFYPKDEESESIHDICPYCKTNSDYQTRCCIGLEKERKESEATRVSLKDERALSDELMTALFETHRLLERGEIEDRGEWKTVMMKTKEALEAHEKTREGTK